MKKFIKTISNFLSDRFNLDEDKAEEKEIVENIKRDVNFKGTNLWTLIFAIMMASIGLNVNSTAVIIGAMLISPLMGPIMGVGLAIGTNDYDLLKVGIKNLVLAAVISIITSAVYFSISPIRAENSELLARTNPSLWDVFIAFFGGLAGIVAGTRTQRGNAIPGVAIATALMPPLCTAGFGLATGNWFYLFGALYLFFINSFFICLATFLIVKRLRFHKKEFQTRAIERRVGWYIWTVAIITILPSIYLAYRIVDKSIFEGNARRFVRSEFKFVRTQVVSKNYRVNGKKKEIDLLLIGEVLPPKTIDSLKNRMSLYGLDSPTLVVRQGLNAKREIDVAQIKASILEDVLQYETQQDSVAEPENKMEVVSPDLQADLRKLYPDMEGYSLSQSVFYNLDSSTNDTIILFTAKFKKRLSIVNQKKLQALIKERFKPDSVKLLIE